MCLGMKYFTSGRQSERTGHRYLDKEISWESLTRYWYRLRYIIKIWTRISNYNNLVNKSYNVHHRAAYVQIATGNVELSLRYITWYFREKFAGLHKNYNVVHKCMFLFIKADIGKHGTMAWTCYFWLFFAIFVVKSFSKAYKFNRDMY